MLKETLIFVGAGSGGLMRYWLGGATEAALSRYLSSPWPVGTLAVNVLGCAAMGVLLVTLKDAREEWRGALLVGLLGGFTTFSAFSKETLELAQSGRWAAAAIYIAASILLCLGGVTAGWWATRSIIAV